jgi:sulfide dehydrogenase cytochrome subunit
VYAGRAGLDARKCDGRVFTAGRRLGGNATSFGNPDRSKKEQLVTMTRPLTLAALLLTASPWCLAQDSMLGRNLAATCANCHGTNGVSKGEVASLAGLPADRIVASMAAFKSGAPATVMHQIAKGYTDDQIKLMAAYFAAQKK